MLALVAVDAVKRRVEVEFKDPDFLTKVRGLTPSYKRELAEGSITKAEAKSEPPRAQRRLELRAYARKVHVHPRLVWQTYQVEKQKGLTAQA